MTKVKMLYNDNLICGFYMEGHAGYNVGGPDVICASLSAASQMTVNGIIDATGFYIDDIVTEFDLEKGIMKVELDLNEIERGLALDVVVQQLFKSFELYIRMLSEQYPENVMLISTLAIIE